MLAATTCSLWIVSDFMLMAPTIALFIVLYRYNRTLALVGTLFAMFFNIYDISVTELNSLTLVSLSQGYASASTDAMKASFVVAATYGYYGLPIQTFLSYSTGTFGYLVWCVVALIGSLAPLLPASGIVGLCQFVTVPLCALWFILVGPNSIGTESRVA